MPLPHTVVLEADMLGRSFTRRQVNPLRNQHELTPPWCSTRTTAKVNPQFNLANVALRSNTVNWQTTFHHRAPPFQRWTLLSDDETC